MKESAVRVRLMLSAIAVVLTCNALHAQVDCSTPNGTFPVVPGSDPALCDEHWGVEQNANGVYSWGGTSNSGYSSVCWNALAWYYGVNQVIDDTYYHDDDESPAPIMTDVLCGLNLETNGLAIHPPYGFAASFNLLAPPGIGDFLPPASTIGESSASLVPPGMGGESTWWNDASRQTLKGAVDLVTGLPLPQVNLLDLPFDGANFRLTRTRSNHRRDQTGFGAADGTHTFDYMTASERWWDWSGQGWMTGENPLLIVDSTVPDLVGNNPKTTWLVLDAHHSIPFQQIESTGIYAAPPRFRAKLTHNGAWGVLTDGSRGWVDAPTQMDVYLYDGALKYTFVIIREDVPPHLWNSAPSGVGDAQDDPVVSSLHDRPYLTNHFPAGTPNYKSWSPFNTCINPGLGLPYLGLCVEINDNYGHTVEINYHGVKQREVDYFDSNTTNTGFEDDTDGNTCIECGQSCARKGAIQSVKLKTDGQIRWSLIYIYRGFYNRPAAFNPGVDDVFYDVQGEELAFREQDLWGSYHIDRIYAFENMDPEPDIITAAGNDYFLKLNHHDIVDLDGLGPDPLYDLNLPDGIANKWTHSVQNHFAQRLDANGDFVGVEYHALKLMTEVRTRTYEDDTNEAVSLETVKRWVYHHESPEYGQPAAVDDQLAEALRWELYWLSRIYTPEDVADVLSSTALVFGSDSAPTQLTLRDLVYMTDPGDQDWSEPGGPTSLGNEPDELGVIAGYATYRFGNGRHATDRWPSANGSQDAPDQTTLVTKFLVNDKTRLMTDMRSQVVGRAAIPDETDTTRYYQINRLRVLPFDFVWVDSSYYGNGVEFVSEWISVGEEMNYRSAFVAPYQWHAYTPAYALADGSGWPHPESISSPDLTAVRWITIIDEYADERDLFPSTEDIAAGYGKYDGTHSTKKSQLSRRVVELSASGHLLRDRNWEFGDDGVIRSGGGLGEQYVYRTIEDYFATDLNEPFPPAPAEPGTANGPGENREHDGLSSVRNELLTVEYRSVGWSAAELIQEDNRQTDPNDNYASEYGFTRFTEYAGFHPGAETWADYDEDSEKLIPLRTRVQPVAQGIRRGSAYELDSNAVWVPSNNTNHKYTSQTIRDEEIPSDVLAQLEFIEAADLKEDPAAVLLEIENPNWQSPATHYRLQRSFVERGQKLDDTGIPIPDVPDEEQPVLSRMLVGVPRQVYPGSGWYYPVEREFYDPDGNPIWSCTGQLMNPHNPNASSGTDPYESLTFTYYERDDEGRSLETVLDAEAGASIDSSNPGVTTAITIGSWPIDENGITWQRVGSDSALNYVTSFVYDEYAPGLCDIYYPNGRRWARRVCKISGASGYNANVDEYSREYIYNNLEYREVDGVSRWVTTTEGKVKDFRSTDVLQSPLVTRTVTYTGVLPNDTGLDATLRVGTSSQPDWVIKTAIELGVDANGRLQQASLLERSPSGALLAVGTKEVNDLGELYREQEIDETITIQTRNSLGQTIRVYQGTEDRRWYLPPSAWGDLPPANMILLERTDYGSGVHDAWLPTVVRQYDRSPGSWAENDPHGEVLPGEDAVGQPTVIGYDWRNRAVRTDTYEAGVYGESGTQDPRRLSTTLTYLDFLDRPYIEVTYGADPEPGASGSQLVIPPELDPVAYYEDDGFPRTVGDELDLAKLFDDTGIAPTSLTRSIYSIDGTLVERRSYDVGWDGVNDLTYLADYSYNGRGGTRVFSQSPGGSIEVTRVDPVGRVSSTAMMMPSTQAYSAGNLPVGLEELTRTDFKYDADGNVVETQHWERVEDDADPVLGSTNAVRTRTVNWYDVHKRLVATAELGTESSMGYRYGPEVYAHSVPGPGDDWSLFTPPYWDEGSGEVVFDGTGAGQPGYALKDALVRVYDYDENGNKVLSVDPEGVLTRFEYNASNRLLYKIENAADPVWENRRMTGYYYQYGRLVEMNLVTQDLRGNDPVPVGDIAVTATGTLDPWDIHIENGINLAHRTRLEYGAVIVKATTPGNYVPVSYSNKLIGAMHLPNEQTGYPADDADVFLHYTYSGQVAQRFNSAGEAIKYRYDDLGRLITVEIGVWDTSEPPDYVDIDPVDPTGVSIPGPTEKIRYIEYAYDDRGNLSDVMAWTEKNPAERQLIAHTRMVYDGRDRLVKEYQLHGGPGPIDEAKTPHMLYAWEYEPTDLGLGTAEARTGHDRLSSMTYPVPDTSVNPRTITLGYGSDGLLDDLLSRPTRMDSNIGTPILAHFEYTGGGRRVATRLKNGKINDVADYDPQATPGLNGYDRFGRDTEARFTGIAASDILYRANYTFDKVGNRTSALIRQADVGLDPRDNIRSVVNTYDRLHRLIGAEVGQLDLSDPAAPQIVQGTEKHNDSWSLDLLGNWSGRIDDQTGDILAYGRRTTGTLDDYSVPWSLSSHDQYSSYDLGLIQSVTQRDSITELGIFEQVDADPEQTGTAAPVYDGAGRTLFDGSYGYHYDAWGRVVQISEAWLATDPVTSEEYLEYGTMLKHFVYDGLGRLIRTTSPYPDADTAGGESGTGETRSINFFYDGARRVQEVIHEEAMGIGAAMASGDPGLEQLAMDSTNEPNPDGLNTPQSLELGQNPDPSYSRNIHREYVWGPGDRGPDELLLQTDEADDEYWCLMDGGGDLVALVSVSGQSVEVVRQWTYDAYGAILTAEHLGPSLETHVGHKGLFMDRLDVGIGDGTAESPRLVPYAHTIYQNRNRSYSPSLGRFLQMDPNQTAMALLSNTASHGRGLGAISIAFSMEGMYGDGLNLYQYLGSNPWTNSDPLGLSSDPFDIVDDFLATRAASASGLMTQLGQGAQGAAIVSSYMVAMLPFPGISFVGDLALVALGEQSLEDALKWGAMGIIPGGVAALKAAKFVQRFQQASRNANLVGRAIRVGSRTVTVTAEMARHVGTIKPYDEAKLLTRGFNHAIEAHHLIPNRYLKYFPGLTNANVPAVILLNPNHREIERTIRAAERVNGGAPTSRRQAARVLEQAYSQNRQYLKSIRRFLR